jgi:hypothetical protein
MYKLIEYIWYILANKILPNDSVLLKLIAISRELLRTNKVLVNSHMIKRCSYDELQKIIQK